MLSESQPLAEGSGKLPSGEKRLDKRRCLTDHSINRSQDPFRISVGSGRDDDAKA